MMRFGRSFVALVVALSLALPVAAPAQDKVVKVDLNRATLEQLVALPKIGPAVAQRVIEYREKSGGFKKVEDLLNVRGIGDKTFAQLRDRITVGEPAK
jgi:competence protein ComEA